MARSQRSSKLETRTARLKLPHGAREFLTIGKGLALAYRRTEDGYGTWQSRAWDGARYRYHNLGRADDFQEANGADVLDFYQAQGKAREFYEAATKGHIGLAKDVTVEMASDRYLEWYRQHRKAIKETEHAIRAHILPVLGGRKVADLTSPLLRNWLEKLASSPARIRTSRFAKHPKHKAAPSTADEKRARKATANRLLNVLKAILNRAFQDGLIPDDSAWRKVKPFPKVDEARIRFLTGEEAALLTKSCDPALRSLLQGALLTGARYGELIAMHAKDINIRTGQVYVAQSKSGRPRHIPLNQEGMALFRNLLTDKKGDDLVFTKSDGTPWGKNHQVRLLVAACDKAKIAPPISFHELRHTYASHLAQAGVDLLTISKLLGHADTRITSRHYAHLADTTLAAAVTKLPNFSANESKNPKPGKPSRPGHH